MNLATNGSSPWGTTSRRRVLGAALTAAVGVGITSACTTGGDERTAPVNASGPLRLGERPGVRRRRRPLRR